MNRTTDVIVVGSGLAGLMAAWAAAKNGCSVAVISEGMGCLAISPDCIDLLGYDNLGQRLDNPWDGMINLNPDHPYTILGRENIEQALADFVETLADKGVKYHTGKVDGKEVNTLLPTIMGTVKPSWLVPDEIAPDILAKAEKILVVSVKGFRDCRPALVASQLVRYPAYASKDIATLVLPAPFDEHGRSLNALDLAHFVERREGRDWLVQQLKGKGKEFDLVLLPPMLGLRKRPSILSAVVDSLGCPALEMLSVPPGVGGLRLRRALVDKLVEKGVEFYENAQITGAVTKDGKCVSLELTSTGRQTSQYAKAFVIATGGILSGGIILGQGKAKEAIFGLDIPVPENVDEWSEPEVFGKHLVSRLGVKVDNDLRAVDSGLSNVFFAGRTIGGYDQAAEKSGHGVAISTGWYAGRQACKTASQNSEPEGGAE